jgi:para-nitrobenzyl esterase
MDEADSTPNSKIGRRQLFGLAAGLAVAGAGATARAEDAPAASKTRAEAGPGIPTVTPVVTTTLGRVQGLVQDGVHCFKGVRYGAAPVGPLRFMPPQKPAPWSVISDCSSYGAPAMQLASGIVAAPISDFAMQMNQVFTTPSELKIQNEDCLFLNVWTPAPGAGKRPVMVWIHGGGYAYGSGGQPIYDGEGLARHGDVVVVSMNHRLNAFGYLYLGELMGPAYASSGNVGMLDLVAALEWVRDNIAFFGGDPGNVMIMGQSGGGAKVSTLMAMPAAKGLFHKASIQSGPGLKVGRKPAATQTAKAILDDLGVAAGDIKALQAVPAQAIAAAAAKHPGGFGMGGLSPILDEVVIPRDPFDPDASPLSAEIPILIGCVKDEMTIFTAGEPWFGTMTEADLQARVKPFGAKGQAMIAELRKLHPDYSPTYLYVAAVSAQFALANSIRLAERKAAQHAGPAYFWYLTWETPTAGGAFKTPHTMEIPFMMYSFDKVRTLVGEGPAPKRMADQIAGAWIAFARTGKPDGPATPHWPAYDADKRASMIFNLKSEVVDDPYPDLRKILMS